VNVRGTDLVRGIAQRLGLDAGHYISLPDLIRALAVLSGRRIHSEAGARVSRRRPRRARAP
jgi:hypothetical protein